MQSEGSLAQRAIATAGVMLATLTYTLDSTIANIALPHMQGSISASGDQMVWVLTSYMVAAAVMTPLSGWLALKIGRKLLFQISTVTFMVASMLCGAATSLPEIVAFRVLQGSISASGDQMVWVLTSYMVAAAVMTPLSGWLALKIGRKLLFQISTVTFMVASMLCGAATSLPEIVAFRVLQGLAGASLLPLSQSLMLDMWPAKRIPVVMAIWSAVVTAAPIIGPTLGGYLTDTLSWRWAFYVNVPLDLAAVATVQIFLSRDDGGRQPPFDWIGFIGIVMFSVGIQLTMERGEIKDWFDSTEIQIEATLAALGLYLFLLQMFTARHPFFSRGLFRDRNFNFSMVMTLLLGTTLFASAAFLPVMMQQLFGYSATHAGYVSMPRGYGSLLAFLFAPFLIGRIGARSTMLIGICISVVSLWQMGHFALVMDESSLELSGFLQGAGSGLAFNPMSVLTFATLSGTRRTEASVVGNMMRSISGSLGIAFYATLQLRQTETLRGHMVSHVVPGDLLTDMRLPELASDPGLAALSAEVNRQAAMIGYNTAFGYMCLSSLLMLPIVFMMRPSRKDDKPDPAAMAH